MVDELTSEDGKQVSLTHSMQGMRAAHELTRTRYKGSSIAEEHDDEGDDDTRMQRMAEYLRAGEDSPFPPPRISDSGECGEILCS
jgi:hypothetical protein